MTAKKTHWLRNSIIILLICGIAGLALTVMQFFGNPTPTYATATIEITFEGASNGIAPNGTAFNISDITSDEVLSAALETASLNDTYTVEQIRESLVARGVYPDDIAEQVMSYESLLNFTANREITVTDYHPTTFEIALYSGFDEAISQDRLQDLMKAIVSAYKEHFAKVYANGLQKGTMLFSLDAYDYPQQLEIIQGHFSTLANYAQEVYDKHPTFKYEGMGFNDISVRLNNLISSDITRLNADLTMNALSRDSARLLDQYQFEIRDLTNQLESKSTQLDKLDKLIDSYDKNEIIYLSTANNLKKIDGNASETYDSLVNQRKDVSDDITALKSKISNYQLKITDLLKNGDDAGDAGSSVEGNEDAAEGTAAELTEEEISSAKAEAEREVQIQTAALEKGISALVEKGDAIIDDYQEMLRAFNQQEINDETVTVTHYGYETPKILSGAFVKQAIMTAGPICAIGFMLCMVLIIASRRREEKQK